MEIIKTELSGLVVLKPRVFEDDRGYFFESFNKNTFENAGLHYDFVQDNQSKSEYGVLRGLHYQLGEYAQAKLVRVLQGEVLDVVVDIRKGSPTYGQSYSELLSENNYLQMIIPRGFAHGFVVLSETAVFSYKCDNFYNKESEGGILYNDPELKIDWRIDPKDVKLSPKDAELPLFKDCKNDFEYTDK